MNFFVRTNPTERGKNVAAQPQTLIFALSLLPCCSLFLCLSSLSVHAMAAGTADSVARGYGGMLQVILGLGLVLAAIAGCAWLLRRFGGLQAQGAGAIKVIGGSAVGQRERVVLVEVADTWLVIGVAPGQVTALHSMPKGDITNESDADVRQGFPRWLRQVKEKRDAQQHSE
jgi:flagellar protein FliO/FliZ